MAKVAIGVVVLIGIVVQIVFLALVFGFDISDPHDRCTTKLYSGIRVCDMQED